MKRSFIISVKQILSKLAAIMLTFIVTIGIFYLQLPNALFVSMAKASVKLYKEPLITKCKNLFSFEFYQTVLASMPMESEYVSPIEKTAVTAPSPAPTVSQPEQPAPDSVDFSNSISSISVIDRGIIIKNQAGKNFQINKLLEKPLQYQKNTDGYKVLVVHSHTTESYFPTDRSDDATKNMIQVGKEFTSVLESNGIKTLHITTVHDVPYTASYKNSLASVTQALKDHPTIEVVIDLHRDAIYNTKQEKLKPLATVNGISAAQVMIVTGTEKGGLPHPDWEENLAFSVKLQNEMLKSYPGLARPVDLRKERFNTHTTKNSIILEIGANGNTLEEAIAGGNMTAQALANVLLQK